MKHAICCDNAAVHEFDCRPEYQSAVIKRPFVVVAYVIKNARVLTACFGGKQSTMC